MHTGLEYLIWKKMHNSSLTSVTDWNNKVWDIFCSWSKVLLAQSCLTLCTPIDQSLPDSSVQGILQVSILEWVAIPFSKGASKPRDQIQVSCIADRFFTIWATRKAPFWVTVTRINFIFFSFFSVDAGKFQVTYVACVRCPVLDSTAGHTVYPPRLIWKNLYFGPIFNAGYFVFFKEHHLINLQKSPQRSSRV